MAAPTPPDAPESVAAGARPTGASSQFDSDSPAPAASPACWPRRLLAGLLAAAALAGGGAWLWAGSEGSLASALTWVGARQPLQAEGVTGTLRGGGTVRRLVWSQDGLRVEADEAELRWRPAALLSRTLRIEQLSARRLLIDDQRPASTPPAGPPEALTLPLHVRVAALRVDELHWAGPPTVRLAGVAGHYAYDGGQHQLALDHIQFDQGRYRLLAALTAHAPLRLDMALAGALTAPVPGAAAPLPLSVQATLRGPLTELQAQAELQATTADAAPELPTLPPLAGFAARASPPALPAELPAGERPQARASARLSPWAAQPLAEAHARVHALDLAALWSEAPRTLLSGALDLMPLPGSGWAVVADLSNRAPGPWDQGRLPVDELQADALWQDDTATVRTLKARTGGGTLQVTGQWHRAAAAGAPPWRLDARLDGVDPARLHRQLAALPVDGTARLGGAGSATDFDVALQARPTRATPPPRAGESAAQARARELRALRLHSASAQGRWDAGLLRLDELRLRTDDAELAGTARLHLQGADSPAGQADLRLTAPGLRARTQGELHANRGGGSLSADLNDAARALSWARQLPGSQRWLGDIQTQGRASLQARWRGGWRDPAIEARLSVPTLAGRVTGSPPLQLRDVLLTADGRLAQARWSARGEIAQGERRVQLSLSASGGRSTPEAPLAASGWRLRLEPWQASLRDPALGAGTWQLAGRGALPLSWSPARGGSFEAGAGELSVSSPAPTAQALLTWGPLRWQDGELSSSGRLSGLPLQWVERLAGTPLRDAGLSGDIVFDGGWSATLGRQLRLQAELARVRGDVTVLATDAETGVQSRVAAGLREARLRLRGDGPALQAELRWDSERAGRADGQLHSTLAATTDADGRTRWSWPQDAALTGSVRARLPHIAAWSVLAPPGWRLGGALAAELQIAGTRAAPAVTGTLSADGMALRSVVDGLQFQDGRLRARLDGTRLLIDEFSLAGAGGAASGGRLNATGEAAWRDGRAQARLNATLQRLRVSVRDDRQLSVSGTLHAALDGRALSADGRLSVDQALIVLPDDSRPALGDDVIVRGPDGTIMHGRQAAAGVARPTSAAGQQDAARAEARAERPGPPLTARVQVEIDLGQDFRLRGMGIDTRLAGVLTLAADGPATAMPRVRGTVRTVGGSFHAYSQQLVIERGQLVFQGAADNPVLDIVALRPKLGNDQRAGVQVAGTALLPRVRLYSAPSLPDNQTLAWLLLGRPAPDSGAEAAMLQSAALALLGGREGRGLAARFGLDELSFSGGGEGEVNQASVTLGKRLSERLYAAYEHGIAGTGGTLMIFYELSRRWSLRGQAGVENSALDLIFKLAYD